MNLPARAFVIIFIIFGLSSRADCIVEDVIDILKLVKDVGAGLLDNWGIIGKYIGGDVSESLTMPREKKLLNKFAEMGRDIGKLEIVIQSATSASLSAILHALPQNTRLELRLHELSDLITRVSVTEAGMRQYTENPDIVERLTLENFAQWCISHEPGSIPGLMERIHALVSPDPSNIGLLDRGVLELVIQSFNNIESQDQLCSLQQSPHQLIYNMYNTITLTEVKGYTMMQFSWMLLRLYGKGNFTLESNLMRQRFQERSMMALASVKAALKDASTEIWRCDPSYHEEGETFVAVTRLLQGYVENEVDMNTDMTCKENCAYYTYAKNHGCFKEQYCAKQSKCSGRILNCQYIDSDMWICPAERSSGRRYEWIEYENGRTLGEKGYCKRGTTKVDSWWRLDLYHCSYCLCLCDEPSMSSDRYFSMRPALANVTDNKVVTGFRFAKVNRVIHLQIGEGTLLPRGKIDPASIRWMTVQPLNINDPSLAEGVDYHTMSYEERIMDLDDLHGDDGHLMTGVRFRKVGSHLNFEIRITPFNFTTGRLINPLDMSTWISNDNTDVSRTPRTRVPLKNPNIPTRSRTPSIPDSKSDQYIEFTNSDFDADVAQTTVPFLDAQPVTSLYPVPLAGAGIYHKGRDFYGGFVAPKVFTYDYSKHMVPVFPILDEVVN